MTVSERAGINWSGFVVTSCLTIMLAFCLWALVTRVVPDANRDALVLLIGILSRDFATVVNFHFSSTSQAKKQADTIEKQATTIQEAQSALAPLAGSKPDVVVPPGDSVVVKAGDKDKT